MGQNLNYSAIFYGLKAVLSKPRLFIPACSAKDIRYINFKALWDAGYRGICFDKDNTLTLPYENTIYEPIQDALEGCKQIFEDNIALVSNSAGTCDDVDFVDAKMLEKNLGIAVLRHPSKKKPACASDIINHFKIHPVRIILIGDRLATDVLMANSNQMLSIHTRPFTSTNDNTNATLIRRFENFILDKARESPHSRGDLQDQFINKSPL